VFAAMLIVCACLSFTADAFAGGLPVLPAPGQTVTWSLADSPVQVGGQLTIPEGGTVLVDPGVALVFSSTSRLFVEGTLSAAGTPSDPVTIVGSSSGWLVAKGTVQLSFCTIDNTIAQGTNGLFHITDSTFGPSSWTLTDSISGPTVAILERCTVLTPFFSLVGEVLMRDVELLGLQSKVGGYMRFENVTSSGSPLELWREYQPMLLDGVQVNGVAGPGLLLDGGTDFLIDSSVALTNNSYPLQVKGAGLLPGSVLPTSGNTNNAVLGPQGNKVHKGAYTFPDVGLPYVLLNNTDFGGPLSVEPGVTLQFGPSGGLLLRGDFFRHGQALRGLPGQPIRLESATAGATWLALGGAGGDYLFEHLEIDSAGLGVSSPQSQVFLNECVISNCLTGASPSGLGGITAQGVRWIDNVVGAEGDMAIVSSNGLFLDGFDRPNVFTGNGVAVTKGNLTSVGIPARGNWWNHGTGPFQATSNPGGQGDTVGFNVDFTGFLADVPDLSDTPPIVRAERSYFLADPGDPLLVQWQASDDVAVASVDILLDTKGGGQSEFQTVVQGLSGDTTQYAFVMPDPGFNTFAKPALLRIVATDSAGQTSFDEVTLHVSSAPYSGTFAFNTDLSGVFEPLERFKICWNAFGIAGANMRVYLELGADERRVLGPAGSPGNSCTFSNLIMPYVSTDTARLAVIADGNGNQDEWFFSEHFTIRPNALLGDLAPTVQLLAPSGGETFAPGAVLPVSWTAADDEGLRNFKVQVSLNAGRTWQTVARDLPSNATSFGWTVPDGITVADARLRVIAIDHRFQNSSDGSETSFSIGGTTLWANLGQGLAGSGGVPVLSGDGDLTAGSPTTLSVAGGPAGAQAWWVLGLTELSAAFKGGTLVPSPDVIVGPVDLGASGALSTQFSWPSGLPSATSLYWQTWVADAGAAQGFAATNGLASTTP